jgi:hypothetical protein
MMMTARDFRYNMGNKNSCFAGPSQVINSSPLKTGRNGNKQFLRLTTAVTQSTTNEEKCLVSTSNNDSSSSSCNIFNLIGKEVLSDLLISFVTTNNPFD